MINKKYDNRAFNIFLILLFAVLAFITIYPFWNVLVISLNDAMDAVRGGIYFWPRIFTFKSYEVIFRNNDKLLGAFLLSVSRTSLGTLVTLSSTTFLAYLLSDKGFILRKAVTRLFLITMYLQAGLIPVYLLYRELALLNKFMVYILPSVIGAYYLILMKSYIEDIPVDIKEAAVIDGIGEIGMFLKIIIPLSVPMLATIGLYVAVGQWCSWQDTYFFASGNEKLTTLQYEMVKIIKQSSSRMSDQEVRELGRGGTTVTPKSLQYAIIIISTVPILCVYPFLQRYFVKGITLGAVKG
jgi:putative aldouronate transport system permease protein